MVVAPRIRRINNSNGFNRFLTILIQVRLICHKRLRRIGTSIGTVSDTYALRVFLRRQMKGEIMEQTRRRKISRESTRKRNLITARINERKQIGVEERVGEGRENGRRR